MKKIVKLITIILFIIMLFCTIFCSVSRAFTTNQIDYSETLETFDNPERGFYTPLYYNFKVMGNEDVKDSDIKGNLIHLRLGIGAFSGKVNGDKDLELSSDMLTMFDKILKQVKAKGATAIIRFAYDNFDGDEDLEPSLDMILKHIQQIRPILTDNQDVISYIELGFFGPWGEMHSSQICKPENVSKALDIILENTPEEMKIGARQPKYYVNWLGIEREKLNENITVKGTPAYRVGLFNDGYLGSHSDLGTFENREIEIQWLEHQALHTLYGGEIVATRTSSGNEQIDTINTSAYMSQEAFRTHTTYLNSEYDDDVINAWKDEIYHGSDELYNGQTGYLYIANHLGYRFVLRSSDMNVLGNQKLHIDCKVENVGFANLVNHKVVTIVLEKGDKIYEIKTTDINPTSWNSNEITKVNFDIALPDDIQEGNWNVYLRISQYGDWKEDNNYQCIRLANHDIWNQTIGANYIGTFTFEHSESIVPSEPSDSSEPSNQPSNHEQNQTNPDVPTSNPNSALEDGISPDPIPQAGDILLPSLFFMIILFLIASIYFYEQSQ